MTAEYIVKIKGDTSQLEQTLKKVQGNMKKLDDDEVLIKLNYDGNVKQFNKVFDQVLKSCPELSIQFQYDVNKKILDSELEKMQKMTNLEYDINTSNVNKKIKKMIEDLDEAISLDASEAEIKQQIENIYKYANTAKQAGAKIGNDISEQIYNSIEGTDFENLFEHISDRADRFKLFNISGSLSDEIDKTKSSIEDLKKYTSDLESKGASPFGNTDSLVQLQNEIRIIKEDITELREQTNADSGKMFSEMSAQIQDLNDKLTETLDRMTRLQNPQEFNLGNTIKKWQNKGLEDVERYTPFNSQTMESLSAELEGEYNHITGKLIRESIEQAKFYVDGFIHSHPEKFAAFSDDDLEVFFKLAESGIVHQVITSFEEAMSLDLSKVDNSKFSEILAKVKEEYAKIEQDLSTQFYNNYADQMKQIANLVVDDTLETAPAPYQEIFSSIKERINKLFTDSTVTDFKSYTENVEKIIRTSLTSSSLYQNQSPEGKDKLISQMGKVEEAILGTFENQIYEDTKDVLQQRFQKVLVDVFSDSSFLKEGVTSAIKVESIADFIDFSSIKEAAKDIVDIAKKATEDAQKSHSPSLVAEKLGEYWGEGYAKGILEYKDDVEQAVSTLVKIGELTTKDMLEDMKNILSDDQYSPLVEPIQNVITARQHSLESENEYLSESVANESSRRSVLYDEISRLEEDNSELAQENDNLRRLLTKEAREQDAVARFYNEFGTPSQALDKNVFANYRELLDYLGGSFKEMNEEAEDFSELKLNFKFFEVLTEQLNLSRDELTVIKSDLEQISNLVPGGKWRHLQGDRSSDSEIYDRINHIDEIIKGSHSITQEEVSQAEHLLDLAREYKEKQEETSSSTTQVEKFEKEEKTLSSLIDKLEYLKKIKSESKFMETAEEKLSDMEDKAWDVGGNNPKSEADSQRKIRAYEELSEHIEKATDALDDFDESYEKVIITLKNGEQVEIFDSSDLDNIGLAKNRIKDIQFVLEEVPSSIDEAVSSGKKAFDKLEEIEMKKEMDESSNKTPDLFEGNSGQLSFIENLTEAEEKASTAAEELVDDLSRVKDQIDGQMSFDDLQTNDQIDYSVRSEEKLLPMVIESTDAIEKRNEEMRRMQAIQQAFMNDIGQSNEAKINRDITETLEQRRKEQEKLNEAKQEEISTSLSSPTAEVDIKAEESAKAAEKEAEAMSEVKEESEKASTSKRGFAKANAEVLQSIKESLTGLGSEADLFKALNNTINKLSGKGSDERITTLSNNLIRIREALSGSVDENGFISALQKLSEQGENLKDLASILKASKKQIESVKDSIDDADEMSQEDRDALVYQLSQSEEYEREQKRILAIEKEIEKARKEGQKQAEAYTKKQLDEQNALKNSITEYVDKLQEAINTDNIAKRTGAGVSKDLANRWESLKAQLGNIDITADTSKAQEEFNDLKEKIDLALSPKERKFEKVIPEEVITNLGSQIEDFGAKNTKLSKELRDRLEEVRKRYQMLLNSGASGNALERELKSISSEFNKIKAEANAAGQAGKNFGHMMLDSLKSANARFIANYLSIQDMIRYIRTIATTITEVDSALTELRKVSNATNIRLQQNFEKSAETAKELGSTITDVINQTADWARLGYNVDDAEKLARVTTLFQTVGDNMTAETASEAMISTLKAYGIAVDQSERIVDQYNEVANNFAIDTAGLADSITRAGAALHAGGNALSESMGLIVAANDSLQDPSSVGQMLKTMSMRLRGASAADLEKLGIDTEGMTQGTKSIVQQFKAMAGIDIMEGTDYKSTFQILDELHEKWADLTDAEHAALTEAVGGKRGGSVMSSLMENWADAKAVVEQAENSTGSAMREQQNYAQSIQYSIDRTKASLQELQADLISSGSVKAVVEMANSLVNAIDKIVTNKTALVAIFSTITSAFAVKNNVGGLKNTSPTILSYSIV